MSGLWNFNSETHIWGLWIFKSQRQLGALELTTVKDSWGLWNSKFEGQLRALELSKRKTVGALELQKLRAYWLYKLTTEKPAHLVVNKRRQGMYAA